MKRIVTALMLEEGAACPRGYGLAYRDFFNYKTVWYPLGIHLIVGWFHKLKGWWMKYIAIPNWYPSQLDWHIIKKVNAEREELRRQGFWHGYKEGREASDQYYQRLIRDLLETQHG